MSLKVSKNAVGMLWRVMKRLAKSLEDSSCAAALVGPNIFSPAARNASTTPAASGASGPTTVSSMFSRCTNAMSSGMAVMATFSTPVFQRRARVAGRDVHFLHLRALRQAPGQRVFATAVTDD